MEENIRKYLSSTIRDSQKKYFMPSKKKQIKDTVSLFQQLELITMEEYQEWENEFESILSENLGELPFDSRILNRLSDFRIQTCGQLRELLISDQQNVSLFRIRNIGEKKQTKIVQEALQYGVVKMSELGAEYEKDRAKWDELKRKVVEAGIKYGKKINS
ncbi:MAG: hypothetical protein PHW34_01945 [Hespellia sp.]|nr:hypothetical protein [Hespellia sp.]